MRRLVTVLLAFAVGSLQSWATDLVPIKDDSLATFLADFELLKDITFEDHCGLRVRVLRVQDYGECDGTPQSCPKSEVYVVAASYDEYPEHRVYLLPKRHNWRFSGWKSLPKNDGPDDYVVFELESDEPAVDLTQGWWHMKKVTVKVNYRNGVLLDDWAGQQAHEPDGRRTAIEVE